MSTSAVSLLSRLRIFTLVTALSTLTLNIFAYLLFTRIPDDAYHLARNFRWYLQLANGFSAVGVFGAALQNRVAISIFSTALLIDATFLLVPRLLALLLYLQPTPQTICSPMRPRVYTVFSQSPLPPTSPSLTASHSNTSLDCFQRLIQTEIASWTPQGCQRVLFWLHMTLLAGVIAAVILQVGGALCARRYVAGLVRRETELDDCGKKGSTGEGKRSSAWSAYNSGIKCGEGRSSICEY